MLRIEKNGDNGRLIGKLDKKGTHQELGVRSLDALHQGIERIQISGGYRSLKDKEGVRGFEAKNNDHVELLRINCYGERMPTCVCVIKDLSS